MFWRREVREFKERLKIDDEQEYEDEDLVFEFEFLIGLNMCKLLYKDFIKVFIRKC